MSERARSRHDHNIVPGTQSALNVRAHKERLPWASFQDTTTTRVAAWDATYSLASRAASKARANDYR